MPPALNSSALFSVATSSLSWFPMCGIRISWTLILFLSAVAGPAAGQTAATIKAPLNIVVLIADDWRWDTLGCHPGSPALTPHLDELASQGEWFREARVTTSICMTSRATVLTGQTQRRHGIDRFGKSLTADQWRESYPGRLREADYWCGWIGKWGVGQIPAAELDFSRVYEGRHWISRGTEQRHVTTWNERDALEFLEQRPLDRPFLLNVAFFAPHAQDDHPQQYLPQPASESLFAETEFPSAPRAAPEFIAALPPFLRAAENEGVVRFGLRFSNEAQRQTSLRNYYRLVAEVDAAIGAIVSELKRQGVWEQTLVVFIGDNGYFLGERGLADKWYPYEEALRVPLIIHDPRVPVGNRGREWNQLALNLDIAPTVLAAAGQSANAAIEGGDLAAVYLGEGTTAAEDAGNPVLGRTDFLYEHPTITRRERIPSSTGVIGRRWKYVYWPEWNYEQLFDLQLDPGELVNRATLPEEHARLQELRARLADLQQASDHPDASRE